MAERTLAAWIGKDVWVVIDDEEAEPYFGVLEGWAERGVILRYTERAIRMREERGSNIGQGQPCGMTRLLGIMRKWRSLDNSRRPTTSRRDAHR